MSSLKELRSRIKSIKSTKKLVAAMKMVSAAKLRRSQEKVVSFQSYAEHMENLIFDLMKEAQLEDPFSYLSYNKQKPHLLFVVSSERGLCGSYNTWIVKEVRSQIKNFQNQNIPVRLAVFGTKGREELSYLFPELILSLPSFDEGTKEGLTFEVAHHIGNVILGWLAEEVVGSVTAVGGIFKNVLTQTVHSKKLIPFNSSNELSIIGNKKNNYNPVLIEPSLSNILSDLLKQFLATQIYKILLENILCEHAARLTAMDNANRNAEKMVQSLQLTYNRTRQAHITNELIEVISGAQAAL